MDIRNKNFGCQCSLRQSYLHIGYHATKHEQNLNENDLYFLYATKITVCNKRKVYLKCESVSFA